MLRYTAGSQPVSPRLAMTTRTKAGSKRQDASRPIQLHSWATPNGQKVHILLEELSLPYEAHAVNIGAGEQFAPEFLAISPNNKIPAILDPNGPDGKPFSVFESGAILVYLASKTGQLLGRNEAERFTILQWVMFQMGGVGPMLGQNHHFRVYAPEKLQYAIDRYTNEARRLYGVIDKRLSQAAFLGGDRYSIADIAVFPWLVPHERQGIDLDDYPHLKVWFDGIAGRPAVARGMALLKDLRQPIEQNDKAREIMFGTTQYARR